jgi:hypothetical protein
MHPRYAEWLIHVFDHAVGEPGWYFDPDAPEFAGTEADFAVLIRETFERSGHDLARFSDAQVNQGLWYVVSPSASDFIFSLWDGNAPVSDQLAGIHSMLAARARFTVSGTSRAPAQIGSKKQ